MLACANGTKLFCVQAAAIVCKLTAVEPAMQCKYDDGVHSLRRAAMPLQQAIVISSPMQTSICKHRVRCVNRTATGLVITCWHLQEMYPAMQSLMQVSAL